MNEWQSSLPELSQAIFRQAPHLGLRSSEGSGNPEMLTRSSFQSSMSSLSPTTRGSLKARSSVSLVSSHGPSPPPILKQRSSAAGLVARELPVWFLKTIQLNRTAVREIFQVCVHTRRNPTITHHIRATPPIPYLSYSDVLAHVHARIANALHTTSSHLPFKLRVSYRW